jgi:hypothetical protein
MREESLPRPAFFYNRRTRLRTSALKIQNDRTCRDRNAALLDDR